MKRRQRGRAPILDCQCARRHVPPAERRGGRPHEASAGGHRKPTRQTLAHVRWTTDVTVLPVSRGLASKPNARFEPVRAGCAAGSWQCFPVCRRALFRPGDAGGRPSLPERRSRGSRAFPSIRGARRLRGKRFDASAIVPRLVGPHGLNAIRYREYGSGLMPARYVALIVRHGRCPTSRWHAAYRLVGDCPVSVDRAHARPAPNHVASRRRGAKQKTRRQAGACGRAKTPRAERRGCRVKNGEPGCVRTCGAARDARPPGSTSTTARRCRG